VSAVRDLSASLLITLLAFLRLPFSDPLLSLTVSTTLRDKAVSLSQASHPFVIFLAENGILPKLSASGMSILSKQQNQEIEDSDEDDQTGLEEVNLLEGLSAGGLSCITMMLGSLRVFQDSTLHPTRNHSVFPLLAWGMSRVDRCSLCRLCSLHLPNCFPQALSIRLMQLYENPFARFSRPSLAFGCG